VSLSATQFDDTGNFSFGVEEHTDFLSQEYDPSIGIYGMDVTVNVRPPWLPRRQAGQGVAFDPGEPPINAEDAVAFVESNYDVEVERMSESETEQDQAADDEATEESVPTVRPRGVTRRGREQGLVGTTSGYVASASGDFRGMGSEKYS